MFILVTFARSWCFAYGNLVAAKNIFKKLLTAILRRKINFFSEETNTGRIINRFSVDI